VGGVVGGEHALFLVQLLQPLVVETESDGLGGNWNALLEL
jgi:hypothetical protein